MLPFICELVYCVLLTAWTVLEQFLCFFCCCFFEFLFLLSNTIIQCNIRQTVRRSEQSPFFKSEQSQRSASRMSLIPIGLLLQVHFGLLGWISVRKESWQCRSLWGCSHRSTSGHRDGYLQRWRVDSVHPHRAALTDPPQVIGMDVCKGEGLTVSIPIGLLSQIHLRSSGWISARKEDWQCSSLWGCSHRSIGMDICNGEGFTVSIPIGLLSQIHLRSSGWISARVEGWQCPPL